MNEDRRRVLSIVGPGRSGTTILSSILGEVPGIFSAGELRWLWGRDLVTDRLCACGETPDRCPVWSSTVERSLGIAAGEQRPDRLAAAVREVTSAQQHATAMAHRLRLLTSPGSGRPADPDLACLTGATVSMVNSLFEVTGAHTLVDASKRPQEAAVLAGAGVYDHYVVHIVRDPRAVVYSWRRSKPVRTAGGERTMPTRGQGKTVVRWLENAAGAELLRRHVEPDRWMFVRYEDFARAPRETVERVLALLGVATAAPFLDARTVELGENHTLSGNPNRFSRGPVTIRADREWQAEMPRSDRGAIAAATFPMLLRYQYPLLSPRR